MASATWPAATLRRMTLRVGHCDSASVLYRASGIKVLSAPFILASNENVLIVPFYVFRFNPMTLIQPQIR